MHYLYFSQLQVIEWYILSHFKIIFAQTLTVFKFKRQREKIEPYTLHNSNVIWNYTRTLCLGILGINVNFDDEELALNELLVILKDSEALLKLKLEFFIKVKLKISALNPKKIVTF